MYIQIILLIECIIHCIDDQDKIESLITVHCHKNSLKMCSKFMGVK